MEIEQASGKTPQALLDAPVAYGLEKSLVLAYNHLASRRQAGMILNPIPLSEIQSYIDLFGPPDMPIQVFIDLIGVMDSAYLEKMHGNKPASSR